MQLKFVNILLGMKAEFAPFIFPVLGLLVRKNQPCVMVIYERDREADRPWFSNKCRLWIFILYS